MFLNKYIEGNFLVIETIFFKEKIRIDSIDDVVIFNKYPSRKYAIYMFFTQPIKYEANKGWINRIFTFIHVHNNNPCTIKRTYYDHEIEPLLLMINKCLPEADLLDLKESSYWRTDDGTNVFSKMKVIYSREKLLLANIFRKHGMMKE